MNYKGTVRKISIKKVAVLQQSLLLFFQSTDKVYKIKTMYSDAFQYDEMNGKYHTTELFGKRIGATHNDDIIFFTQRLRRCLLRLLLWENPA